MKVTSRQGVADVHGKATLGGIRELAIQSVEDVLFSRVYLIEADFDEAFAQRVGRELPTPCVRIMSSVMHRCLRGPCRRRRLKSTSKAA